MLGVKYEEKANAHYYLDMINELRKLGAKSVVITGASLEEGKLGVIGYDHVSKCNFSYFTEEVKARFHGTGDIYSSVCLGGLVAGKSLPEASALAADFTALSITKTLEDEKPNWYGVNFEQAIPMLVEKLK